MGVILGGDLLVSECINSGSVGVQLLDVGIVSSLLYLLPANSCLLLFRYLLHFSCNSIATMNLGGTSSSKGQLMATAEDQQRINKFARLHKISQAIKVDIWV